MSIVGGRENGFRPKPNGRRPCEERMDGLWPWGHDPDYTASNWNSARDGFDVTAPVGSFQRDVSPFRVADGAGNVMEWVADWYAEDAYRDPTDKSPKGPDHGVFKVLRGEDTRVPAPISGSQAAVEWFPISGMKLSVFGVRFLREMGAWPLPRLRRKKS